jgi:hypothetical protein
MADEKQAAINAMLRVFDARVAREPLIERRDAPRDGVVDAARAAGPVADAFAFWRSSQRTTNTAGQHRPAASKR